MSDPVKQLTDTLTLLRLEVADVRKRQVTEDRLKPLQTALDTTTICLKNVAAVAAVGSKEGAEQLVSRMEKTLRGRQG